MRFMQALENYLCSREMRELSQLSLREADRQNDTDLTT
jgi:hypothetical protein